MTSVSTANVTRRLKYPMVKIARVEMTPPFMIQDASSFTQFKPFGHDDRIATPPTLLKGDLIICWAEFTASQLGLR